MSVLEELRHIFTLPQNRSLENEVIVRQLPPGHHLRPRYLDVVTGSDNIPLLSMSGQEEADIGGAASTREDIHTQENGNGQNGARKDDDARARVEDLSSSVPQETLAGGKSFNELPLYEKKSVLINRELE